MIAYEWTSVSAFRYIGSLYGTYEPEYNILWHLIMNHWGSEWNIHYNPATVMTNTTEIVQSVVADFREAVAAAFYDVAKSDATLVPVSCVPSIDAIVLYNYAMRFSCRAINVYSSEYQFIAPTLYSEWKRAVLYRRELGMYTKRMIAGNMFPEEVIGTEVPGTPFYTEYDSTDRIL